GQAVDQASSVPDVAQRRSLAQEPRIHDDDLLPGLPRSGGLSEYAYEQERRQERCQLRELQEPNRRPLAQPTTAIKQPAAASEADRAGPQDLLARHPLPSSVVGRRHPRP